MKSYPLHNFAVLIGCGELEHSVGKAKCNSSSIHMGLLRSGFS
jgi:hypothetical protein